MPHPLLVVLLLLLAPLHAAAQTAPPPSTPFRALWITRWDYRSPDDIKRVIEEAASLGVTDIMWQVRGQADAFYKSDLEPWGRELLRNLPPSAPNDPGYDPLHLATTETHARGLKIHAWVNVMPIWKGKEPPPPSIPAHIFHAHPAWRLHDANGVPQPLNDHYIIINPIYPEAREHVVAVCADIMRRYPVDGLHLDYVRFVSDTMKDAGAYPADQRSLDLFKAATGRAAVASADDRTAYRAYIRDCISDLVRALKRNAVAQRPGAVLTAAVWRRPEMAVDAQLQDAPRWLKEGALDRAMPMIYHDNNAQYESDLAAWVASVGADNLTRLSPGIANYKHTPDQTAEQVRIGERLGVPTCGIFAYASLFESVDPTQDKTPKEVQLRADRRKALTTFLKK